MHRISLLALAAFASSGAAAHADVRVQERTRVTLDGLLARTATLFGHRGIGETIVRTTVVKGDRKATMSDAVGQIVDLRERRTYELDVRQKTYRVVSFSLQDQSDGRSTGAVAAVTAHVAESQRRQSIAGFDTREVVLTISASGKGKNADAGGVRITAHVWITTKDAPAAELTRFERRQAQLTGAPVTLDHEQFATAAGMYPLMPAALTGFEAELADLDGSPISTTAVIEAVPGLEHGLQATQPDSLRAAKGSMIMTIERRVLSISPLVTDADVAVPPEFTRR